MSWVSRFVGDVAQACGDDYPAALKLLGLVVFLRAEGPAALLSGRRVDVRTFMRWAELLKYAGWGDAVFGPQLDADLRRLFADRLGRQGSPPPQARAATGGDSVKGLAEGREAEPSALDSVASGGSLGRAAAFPLVDEQ